MQAAALTPRQREFFAQFESVLHCFLWCVDFPAVLAPLTRHLTLWGMTAGSRCRTRTRCRVRTASAGESSCSNRQSGWSPPKSPSVAVRSCILEHMEDKGECPKCGIPAYPKDLRRKASLVRGSKGIITQA
jgi:hypothetical protein